MHTLEFVLKNINTFNWSDVLFLPENGIWGKETEGMILDPDDLEDEFDEVPKEAKEKN